jgi:hypothetical protein
MLGGKSLLGASFSGVELHACLQVPQNTKHGTCAEGVFRGNTSLKAHSWSGFKPLNGSAD